MAKKIGFVDNYLDNFHANVYLGAIRNELAARGYTVKGCTALDDTGGLLWADRNDVLYYGSVAELNEVVDYFVVLAPNNPETHLGICAEVIPAGKPTYVDKTFAPDSETAEAIFGLADQWGTPVQTSSALRYTNVQTYVREVGMANVQHMVAWGAGSSFDVHAVHPLELVISCMGSGVLSVMRRGAGDRSQLLLNFGNERTAVVNVYTNSDTPFAAAVTTDKVTRHIAVETSRLFIDMAAAILDFFDNGQVAVDRGESLVIRRIMDVATYPEALRGFVVL